MTTPEQHISEIKNVILTESERAVLRNTLRAYSISYIPAISAPVRVWRWAGRHAALALGIVVALAAGATGVSASRAEPGDALYGFRVSINDRVETALVFDDEAQIDLEMRQMQRMIDGEDALRDEELSELAFTDDIPQPTAFQTFRSDDDVDEADDSDEDASEVFDDGSFERELRSIESELQAEEGAGLELDL